jgi:penicillin-binding protein 1C
MTRASARHRWLRRALRGALACAAIFVTMVLVEQAARALFPFPRHLIDELPRSGRVYAEDGTLLRVTATRAEERVLPVPLSTMSPHVVRSAICSEDERFFAHRGVDGIAVSRAVLQNLCSGRVVSGASTITMQVVRILMPHRPRSFAFKVEQMFRARQLERMLSKKQILEIYCNHVPLGGAVCGFEAAARRWFGIGAGELRLDQAATLVSMLPAPSHRSPRARPRLLARLRNRLLARMRDVGELTRREYVQAAAQPLGARRRPWPALASHACDHFLRQTSNSVVRTRLDLRLQQRVEQLVGLYSGGIQGQSDALAVVILQREGAAVAAMVGSASYTVTQLNTATCRRSVGSTLKPFLYAQALECGAVSVRGLVDDTRARFGRYRPANFSRDYVGAMGVGQALLASRNLPAVRLLQSVGSERFADLLRRLGLPVDPRGVHLDAALGTMAASPLQLARAYCRFVGSPRALGLRPGTVRRVLDTLARQSVGSGGRGGAVAFKTGTSSGRRDAWCVAITRECVAVVWMGNLSGRGEPGLVGRGAATRLMAGVVDLL